MEELNPDTRLILFWWTIIPITEMNEFNIPWHIIFGFRDSMVTDTMVNGKWLMTEKKLVELGRDRNFRKKRWNYLNKYGKDITTNFDLGDLE